jgi:branched-chain amino acid transport system permease protein
VRASAGVPGGLAARWGLTVVLVLALVALPYAGDAYADQVGYRMLQLAALASAWNLLAGYTGLVSLGTACFVGTGAYALSFVEARTGAPIWVLAPVAGLVAASLAAVASIGLFRLRGLYFAVGTLALAEAARILMLNLPTFGGASGMVLRGETQSTQNLYWLELIVAALSAASIFLVVARSPSLTLRAVRDDEDVARQMGVNVFAAKFWAFVGAAFLMGLVGALQALKLGAVEPTGAFGSNWTIETVAAVIIGGVGTRGGPLVGAVFFVGLAELLRGLPEIHGVVTGVIVLLVVRFAPRGLWGSLVERWRARRLAAEPVDA